MEATPDVRQISDYRVLAAMNHPLRRRLLTLLKLDGPATVGQLAERTDQAAGNISHHLRALATAGLIEEAPELARDRRERWWRRTASAFRWTSLDFADDAAAEAVATTAEAMNLEHQVAMVRAWASAAPEEHARWPEGPFSTDSWMRATDDELAQFSRELIELIRRWADRPLPDDGAEREPVFVFARAVPGQP
jgi:DNA-binding transcriptional ArsR family regulator